MKVFLCFVLLMAGCDGSFRFQNCVNSCSNFTSETAQLECLNGCREFETRLGTVETGHYD